MWNNGFEFFNEKVVVNFLLVYIKKEGMVFDLFIVFGIIVFIYKCCCINLDSIMVVGELSFSGSVLLVCGVLVMVLVVCVCGIEIVMVLFKNVVEVVVVLDI